MPADLNRVLTESENVRSQPLLSGLFEIRVPNTCTPPRNWPKPLKSVNLARSRGRGPVGKPLRPIWRCPGTIPGWIWPAGHHRGPVGKPWWPALVYRPPASLGVPPPPTHHRRTRYWHHTHVQNDGFGVSKVWQWDGSDGARLDPTLRGPAWGGWLDVPFLTILDLPANRALKLF